MEDLRAYFLIEGDMPQISYRANLSAAIFPLTLAQAGRSVIVPGPDNNFDRRVDPEGEQKDAGIPQAIFMEDVIPTAMGYQSVGAITKTPLASFGSTVEVLSILTLNNPRALLPGQKVSGLYLAIMSNGKVLTNYTDLSSIWVEATSSGPDPWPAGGYNPPTKNQVSLATVRGTSYLVCNSTWYEIEVTLGATVINLKDVTASVTGITPGHDLYVTSSYNYLIVLDRTENRIYWSSTTTPLDFVTSLVSGAGSAIPNELNTQSTFLAEHAKGFFIFSYGGVISAVYTGNARYPWRFVPVSGAGGVSEAQNVAADASRDYAFTVDVTNKINYITSESAQLIAPEVSDWLSRIKVIDTYNQVTDTFAQQQLESSTPIFSRIHLALDRYVLVSYAVDNPTVTDYAGVIVYDTLLKRYGVIRLPHSYILADGADMFFVRRLENNGAQVKQVITDIYAKDYFANAVFKSVLALGKFQYVRSRLLTLDEVEIESVQSEELTTDANFALRILPSLDGKNFGSAVTPTAVPSASVGPLNTYACRTTAKNHTLVLKGAFDVSSVQLTFHVDGGR